MDDGRKQAPKRRVASHSKKRSVNTSNKRAMPSKMRALILAVAAIIVIALVVMIAAGTFGGKSEKTPATDKETTVSETVAESETAETSAETATVAETDTAEETKEATGDERVVYLTFNSTPGEDTAELLDVLDKNNIKATFFVECNESNVSFVKDISERGHAIGIMPSDVVSDVETFKHDLNTARQMIFLETGELSELLRFNGGSRNGVSNSILTDCKAYLDELEMIYYDWNIESADTESENAENIVWNVESQIEENTFKTNVVLMHDDTDADILTSALDQIIPELKEKGFLFDKLSNKTPEMTFDIEL